MRPRRRVPRRRRFNEAPANSPGMGLVDAKDKHAIAALQ